MTDVFRVILEVGKNRRVVAAATDWPGLDRWGVSEEDAIDKLVSYLPRYAVVAERAALARAFAASTEVDVVERVPGSSSTDFWGGPSSTRSRLGSPPSFDRVHAAPVAAATRSSGMFAKGRRTSSRARSRCERHRM